MDYFRDPPNKDVTGWRGPCKVASTYQADEVTWARGGKVALYRAAQQMHDEQ